MPFVVRGPGIQPGSVCHHPVAQYDLLPTFVDLAGGEGPLPGEIDGGSLRPALHSAGQEAPQRALPGLVFHRPARGYSALRVGDMKLVVNWAKNKKLELFDVSRDIGEWNDLAGAMPEKASEMYRVLTDYLKAVNAEAPKDVEY